MSDVEKSGATMCAFKRKLFLKEPSGATASTATWPLPALISTRGCNSFEPSRRKVSRKTCVQNCPNPDQFIQLAAQRPLASEVNAATLPSPYCQTAYTGSSLSEIKEVIAGELMASRSAVPT